MAAGSLEVSSGSPQPHTEQARAGGAAWRAPAASAAALWSVHGQYQPTRRVALDLGVDGRSANVDRESGAPVPNTGGTVLSIAPGAYANVAGAAWLFLRGQIPFVRRLAGVQEVFPTVVAGVQYQVW